MTTALLTILLALAGSAAADESTPIYRLGAGDTITIKVYGEDDLSRDSVITATCRIEFPLIGTVEVCDRTTRDVQKDIQARLADGYLREPSVFVDVKEYGSQKVEVKGSVKRPGVYVLTGPTTLSEAVTLAGGPDSPNVIAVERVSEDGKQKHLLVELDNKNPVWIRPGDAITLLPPATVQVFGQVKNSGPVAYQAGLTVTEALGLAGGATELAGLGRAYIRRADGTQVRVNIRRIQRGKDDDVVLEPNDQLVIRKSIF